MISFIYEWYLSIRWQNRWDPVFGSEIHRLEMDYKIIGPLREKELVDNINKVINVGQIEALCLWLAVIVLA